MPERACHYIGVCVCVRAGSHVCVWVASGESAPLSVVCAVLVPFVKFQRRTHTQTWVCVIGYAGVSGGCKCPWGVGVWEFE